MSDIHAIMLLDVAPKVAEMFRTDPRVADLLDPAVLVDANEEGCVATVVERLQLTELMSGAELASGRPMQDPSPDNAPIAVLVMDENGATAYRVPDPRTHPNHWPWIGDPEDD